MDLNIEKMCVKWHILLRWEINWEMLGYAFEAMLGCLHFTTENARESMQISQPVGFRGKFFL